MVEVLAAGDEPDTEELRKASDTLQQSAMKMGEAIYKNSSADSGSSEEAAPAEDAEFKDVTDEEEKKDDEEKEEKEEKK